MIFQPLAKSFQRESTFLPQSLFNETPVNFGFHLLTESYLSKRIKVSNPRSDWCKYYQVFFSALTDAETGAACSKALGRASRRSSLGTAAKSVSSSRSRVRSSTEYAPSEAVVEEAVPC